MATLAELVSRQELVRLEGGLLPSEQVQGRLIAFPHVIGWFDVVLPELEPELSDGRQSPLEQVDDLLHDFVTGSSLDYWERSHSMRPEENGVWELKTPDIRLIGWFQLRLTFVIAEADAAFRIKKYNLYPGYQDSVVRRREALDLNEPKFIPGAMKMSYELKIDPRRRAAGRFIGSVRKALITAALEEKQRHGLTQQKVADCLGVNRSVINRMLRGETNLTLRSVAELAWAMGWQPQFTLKRVGDQDRNNRIPEEAPAYAAASAQPRSTKTQTKTYNVHNATKNYVEAHD